MPSITTWNRIEPRARSADLADGLAARVHDPLWLLLRQWQVGEFASRSGGSPVTGTVTVDVAALDRYALGTGTGGSAQPLDRTTPIEAVVERERVRPPTASQDVRQAAEAGLHFSRMLSQAKVAPAIAAAYLAAYPIARQQGDAADLSGVVAGRAIDGVKLFADLSAAGDALPAAPSIPADAREAVLAIARTWRAWYVSLFSEPAQATAWDADRFEFGFTLSASADGTSYPAQEYDGGYADWYTFDRIAGAASPPPAVASKTVVLTPVTFRGMPARRFWEMEDAAVDLGALSAAAEDIGRLLLREFALIYGNDWFQFPLVVPTGSRVKVASLSVVDTFGITSDIPHYSAVDGALGRWRAFALTAGAGAPVLSTASGASGAARELLVTASAVACVDGPAVEDVMLLRDELATMVWGVERTITGASGTPVDRETAWHTSLPLAAPPSVASMPQYRLGTTVPDYWIPFMPAAASAEGLVKLIRAKLPTSGSSALSRVLGDIDAGLFLEEVPREGVHVERLYRYARSATGAIALWLSRKRGTGTGQGRSGLAFDILTSNVDENS